MTYNSLKNVLQRNWAGILLALLLSGWLFPQTAKAAYPLVRNYFRSIYSAGTQNWDICQDSHGRMLFANNTGMLTYDSHLWNIYQVSNYTTVRSLLYDSKAERVYAGGSEEFGYFANDEETGKMKYFSLMSTLPARDRHFSEIWNIHQAEKYVWFQGDFSILRYDGEKTITIPHKYKITTSALIKGRMFVASIDGGVSILNGVDYTPLRGNEKIIGKKVCAILPYTQGNILLVTAFDGLFVYDGMTITPLQTDIDHFLKENQVFCAATNERAIVFGTVNKGIIIKDLSNKTNTYVNNSTGMQNNTVLSIYFDKLDNIWLGLDNGIDYVLYNSPITTLFGTSNKYGAGYASLLKNNTLYMGTNQGLYSTSYPISATPEPVELKQLMKSQVWSIDTIGNTILVGNDLGLFQIINGVPKQVTGIPGTWSCLQLRKHKDYALVSTYESFFLIKNNNGIWEYANKVTGYTDAGGHIFEDKFENIWLSHWMKGVFRLRLSKDLKRFEEIKLYDHKKGFPTDRNNTLYEINDELAFSTEGGFFRYNPQTDSMIPNVNMNSIFGAHTSVRLYQSPNRDVWGVSGKFICAAYYNTTGTYDIDSITYKPLLDKLIVGFEDFNFTAPRRLIVSNEDGFYEIDIDREHTVNWKSNLFINNIYATGNPDTLLYTAGGRQQRELKLPYRLNSLRFEFICPEYREQGTIEYSYYLENYDKSWSAFSQANTKEYTQLHEGTYILHIRSINHYDDSKSECKFVFHISPPWYRSIWAICIYLIAAASAIYFAFSFIKMKSHKAAVAVAKRKEAEMQEYKRKAEEETLRKENEIAHLKSEQLEHDVRHKSQELSNATMNVIRKNEILIDISNQINKIQESEESSALTPSANKQLMKIQKLIKENISHDDDWQKFAQNFDVVYENYLKRLVQLYPQLNANDQRLCAYLKMGLSSKEIAPLLNMSYRSVEMNRYRLRKKMELSRDVNLVEYLQRI